LGGLLEDRLGPGCQMVGGGFTRRSKRQGAQAAICYAGSTYRCLRFGCSSVWALLVGVGRHLEKDEEMSMTDDFDLSRSIWDDLTESVSYIREQFATNKIRLVKDER
jgi:hypothetical protein